MSAPVDETGAQGAAAQSDDAAANKPAPSVTFELVTLFPELFRSALEASLLGKAIQRGLVGVHFTDPRDFAPGKHRSVDDSPYGGGSGMVMRPEPVVAALAHLEAERGPAWKVLLDPQGTPLDQAKVRALARRPRLALVCGRYEGFDHRIRSYVDESVSLGDFVLSGGELAALPIVDAVARLHEGVLGNRASIAEESFEAGLLEYPQYTRPLEFRDARVPDVLLSGDHERVRLWRREQSLARTRALRPDLFARHPLTKEDRKLIGMPPAPRADATRTWIALVHHPVLDRDGNVVTTSITNLDIHDLARSSRTYNLSGCLLVTPIEAQRALANRILDGWRRGEWQGKNEHRREALGRVGVVASVEEAHRTVASAAHAAPIVVATSARAGSVVTRPDALLDEAGATGRPLLLLFGTGWGLADEVLDRVDRVLPPIRGAGAGSDYNHLSVRSAAAITLDRLFGDR